MPQINTNFIILILFILAVLIVYLAVLVAPTRASKEMLEPFIHRFFAHRGLYTKDQSIPENSLAAFKAACDAGYGIELDIQLTADGKVVVAHDTHLFRVTGAEGSIPDMTYDELSKLRLFGTDQQIPLLWDVLQLVDGKVPLIIEFKSGERNMDLCREAFMMLEAYDGPYCVESFDPNLVRWFYRYNPRLLRGQLAMPSSHYNKAEVPALARFMMSKCLMGRLGRPHFIAYEIGRTPLSVKLAYKIGAAKVCWVSHNESDAKTNDMVIFEFYEPPISY